MSAPELLGLVLAGGRSMRMGRDKATLVYRGQPQFEVARDLLGGVCADVWVSCRPGQPDLAGALLHDRYYNLGPLAGSLRAMDTPPEADPVMPHRMLMVTAIDTRGLPPAAISVTALATVLKPGRAEITLP